MNLTLSKYWCNLVIKKLMKTLLLSVFLIIALNANCQIQEKSFNFKQQTPNTKIGIGVLAGTFLLNQFIIKKEVNRKACYMIGFSTCLTLNIKRK